MANMVKVDYPIQISSKVRFDDRLPPIARLLYGEIVAVCVNGMTDETNSYFGELYNLSNNRVSKLIAMLKDLGYITVEVNSDDFSRVIKIKE